MEAQIFFLNNSELGAIVRAKGNTTKFFFSRCSKASFELKQDCGVLQV
jgi:hypothetical protein